MAVTPERMTLAEFLALPEVKPARELRHGVVSQKVSPSGPHGSMQKWFGAWIYNFAELRHLAEAFTETRVVLGTDTSVPDVMVYLWDRVPEDADGRLPSYFCTIAPDLVLEVLSPGQTVGPLLDRCRALVGHGVRAAILADPEHMGAYVIRRDRELGPFRAGDVIDLSDILPDFVLQVSGMLERVLPGRRRSSPDRAAWSGAIRALDRAVPTSVTLPHPERDDAVLLTLLSHRMLGSLIPRARSGTVRAMTRAQPRPGTPLGYARVRRRPPGTRWARNGVAARPVRALGRALDGWDCEYDRADRFRRDNRRQTQ